MVNIDEIVNKVHCADSLGFMKTMPDESINCIITSPPYWSLHDYKTDPIIWDGDSNCQHDWIKSEIEHDNMRYRGESSIVGNNSNEENNVSRIRTLVSGAGRGMLIWN